MSATHRATSAAVLAALTLAIASATAAAAVLAGCAKEGAATTSSPPSTTPAATVAPPGDPAVAPGTAAGASGAAGAAAEVTVGRPAPELNVKASDGMQLNSATLKGKPVVVYFYPKDETPGCTKEACAFRDAWNDLGKTNVVLVGVSADNDESHRAFAEHHKLPFHLVSDPDGAIAKKFGVPPFGRQSFVVGADGNVKKIYRSVNVAAHAQEILADLK